MTPAFDDWIAQARAVRIEDEIARRGIKLNGHKHRTLRAVSGVWRG